MLGILGYSIMDIHSLALLHIYKKHIDESLSIIFALLIDLKNIHEILPNFFYKAEMNGIVENEICPVFVTFTNQNPKINPDEVENIRWIKWQDFLNKIKQKPGTYSIWCEQESKLLSTNREFRQLYKQYTVQ